MKTRPIRDFLERHSLLLLGTLFLASAVAFGYQVFAKGNVPPVIGADGIIVPSGTAQGNEYADDVVKDIRIEVGMKMADADAALSAVAVDLAPALVSFYPIGEAPGTGVCWELPDVNLVVWLHSENELVTSIGYWSERGFGSEAERTARAIVLNTGKGSVLVSPELHQGGEDSAH